MDTLVMMLVNLCSNYEWPARDVAAASQRFVFQVHDRINSRLNFYDEGRGSRITQQSLRIAATKIG